MKYLKIKVNWNAITAITAIIALIATVYISNTQMSRSHELFERQFTLEKNQFKFDSIYLSKQNILLLKELDLIANQIKRNDSMNNIQIGLTRQAIFYDQLTKAKVIPKLLFNDLLNKYWNLKRIDKLLNEENSEFRLHYIFQTKLDNHIFRSINFFDLYQAIPNNEIYRQIINCYSNIEKIQSAYLKSNFNTRTDSIPFRFRNDMIFDKRLKLGDISYNDLTILKNTINDIKGLTQKLN